MSPTPPRIAVIGGGITGLTAAHRIGELHPTAKVFLFEASPQLGGVIQSERRDGFLIENGADNFITTMPWAIDFCKRIGFSDELIETNAKHRRAFVVRKGRLHPIPAGFAVMAPSRIWPIITTPTLSIWGKLRMACEPLVRRRQSTEDESLASFVRRRFGREVYQQLVQPLVAGIYTANPEQLSIAATMPQFMQMEQQHGSLIRAMLKQSKDRRQISKASSGVRYSQFVAPREGMSSLVNAITKRLANATIATNAPVEQLSKVSESTSEGSSWRLTIGGDSPQQLDVDAVLLATPAKHSVRLLRHLDDSLATDLSEIEYGSCALVSLGFRRDQINHPLDGFGFVVPLVEGRQILSASFSSIKYVNRAPEGHVLIRAFVGGACQRELVDLDDDQLQKLVLKELTELLAINGQPQLCHIRRRIQAMPQYHVGHPALVERIEKRAQQLPHLALAGNAFNGVGIPQCIRSGEAAAKKLVDSLSTANSPSD
ncbi:MAG: protoporphyrinogen oxidase [Planctomycetes bacterium]|nr:protoporphyrinogen oxidase [Planctomycetota bacterium]